MEFIEHRTPAPNAHPGTTWFVVDWVGLGPAEWQSLRHRGGEALAHWRLLNCLPRPAGRWGKAWRYAVAALQLARRGHRFKQVVVWQQWIGYLWSLLPRRANGPKVVISTLLYAPGNSPPGSLRRWLLARAIDRADALVYFSEALAEDTRAHWPKHAHKVHHTRLPLLEDAIESRSAPRVDPECRTGDARAPLRVFAGGSSDRDFEVVVEAFSGTEVPVTLVCPAAVVFPRPERLTPNIAVHRDVPQARFDALALECDVAVVALRTPRSGCGQLLLTFCMRHRIALIATDADGTRDYVRHERNGLSIPVGDARALRAAYERLARDAGLRSRLRDEGQRLAGELSLAHYARFIDSVSGGRG